MTKLYKSLLQLMNDERGQDLVEYALITGLVAVSMGATIPGTTDEIAIIFSKMSSYVSQAAIV